MTGISAHVVDRDVGGQWQVVVYPHLPDDTGAYADAVDVTLFRDAATEVLSTGTTDPFGSSVAQLRFPAISMLELRGAGDLWWCRAEADVDISWVVGGTVVSTWEGYFASFEYGEDEVGTSLTVSCVGALRQADTLLAKPEYLHSPITFEHAILRQLSGVPSLRLAQPMVLWPTWWTKTYQTDYAYIGADWMVPTNISQGQYWSGMLTRYTGQFEQVLTGYIQQLLSSMHTTQGQFTLMLDRGRQPVLRHRDMLSAPNYDTLVVDLLWPGVSLSITEDHTQKLNAVFVQGKSLSGVSYTGMQISNDGRVTTYEPYAARRAVHPVNDNAWLDPTVMRKEVQLQAADGMSSADARALAMTHLQRFADPGLTGSLTLTTDPRQFGLSGDDSEPLIARQTITAGMNIVVRNLLGAPDGHLFHITEATVAGDGTVSATLDTKFRDQLTVQEVRLRGRDALTPTRMLTTGNYQPTVNDLLFPWSYEMGSGYIPKAADSLFRGIGTNESFPWQNWTRAHPPKDPQFTDKYIKIGPRNANADRNWSIGPSEWAVADGKPTKPHQVLLSSAGTSRLLNIAGYDEDGNVLPVAFHFSLYESNTVTHTAGPVIPEEYALLIGYTAGQHHPFFPNAWETVMEEGVTVPIPWQTESAAGIIAGFGTFYEMAGFWPGTSANETDPATGRLVSETPFSWDMTQIIAGVNEQEDPAVNITDINRASAYALIYCDSIWDANASPPGLVPLDRDVYFLGRIFRAEPGST